jgi:hypothetical protein
MKYTALLLFLAYAGSAEAIDNDLIEASWACFSHKHIRVDGIHYDKGFELCYKIVPIADEQERILGEKQQADQNKVDREYIETVAKRHGLE